MKKIMLDAGHYAGVNRSPIYPSYVEGNMAWKLQSYLKSELEKYGFEVATTRSKIDKDLELYNRGLKAKGYDLFLSLHSNGFDNVETDRVVVIKRFDNKDNTLANAFAKTIENLMKPKQDYQIYTKRKSNGDEWYGVLRGAKNAGCMHSYILEHGFHSNLEGAKWLSNEDNLKELARKEAEVIANYFGVRKVEKFKNGAYNKVARVKCNTSLNVRERRPEVGEDYKDIKVIDELANGKLVTLGYVFDNWGSIFYNGKHGFVNVSYLELVDK